MRKGGRTLSDETMKALLSDYRRPGIDRERFDAWMEGAAAPAARRRRLPVLAIAAALLPAFIVLGTYLRGALSLDAPLLIAYSQASVAPGQGGTAPRSLRAGPDEELSFSSAAESLALAPGTALRVSQDPWRAISREKGYRYGIDAGALYLRHDRGDLPFVISTPFGEVRPAGTSLSLRLDNLSMDLACVEGRLDFRFKADGSALSIPAGMLLSLEAAAGAPRRTKPAYSLKKWKSPAELPYLPASLSLAPPASAPSSSAAASPGLKNPGVSAPSDSPAASPLPAPSASLSPGQAGALIELWSAALPVSSVQGLESDGRSLAIIMGKRLQLRDASTGEPRLDAELEAPIDGLALEGDAFVLAGRVLRRLDAGTGAELWRAATGPVSLSDIALGDGSVAVASADGRIYLFDAATGRAGPTIAAGSGMYGKPLLAGGAVFMGALDRSLRAFDAKSGALLWSFKADAAFTSSRPELLGGGTIVLDRDSSGAYYALDAAGGSLRWRLAEASLGALAHPSGAGILIEDGSGISLLTSDGSLVALPGEGLVSPILAAGSAGSGSLLAGRKGIWLISGEDASQPARLLARGDFLRAALTGEGAFTLEEDGRVRAWRLE